MVGRLRGSTLHFTLNERSLISRASHFGISVQGPSVLDGILREILKRACAKTQFLLPYVGWQMDSNVLLQPAGPLSFGPLAFGRQFRTAPKSHASVSTPREDLWAYGRGTRARGKEGYRSYIASRASSPEADETDWIHENARRQTPYCGLVVARAPEQALQVSVCQPFEGAWLRMVTTIGSSFCALPCPPFTSLYVTSPVMFNSSQHIASYQVTRLSNERDRVTHWQWFVDRTREVEKAHSDQRRLWKSRLAVELSPGEMVDLPGESQTGVAARACVSYHTTSPPVLQCRSLQTE